MEMLPGLLSAFEALWVVQAHRRKSWSKEEEKRKFAREVFSSLPCLVITHTHTQKPE